MARLAIVWATSPAPIVPNDIASFVLMRDPLWFVNRRLVGWNTYLTAGRVHSAAASCRAKPSQQMMTSQPLPDDVQATPGELGDVPTLTITIDGAPADRTHLWFHGGWYVIGSPRTSAGLSADLARRGAARAVSIDYRLAPEHPYPAALQDAQAAYKARLDSGVEPATVAFVGESAGGGLATATMASLGDLGLPQPSCAVLVSPWTDLTLSGASMTEKVGIDPALVPDKVQVRANDYVAGADPADPAISPLFVDLRGLPPMLIQAGFE
jgi:epsilon-lactone hydrolase